MHTTSPGFLAPAALWLTTLFLASSCSDGTGSAGSGDEARSGAQALGRLPIDQQVRDVIAALTDDGDHSEQDKNDFALRVFATWDLVDEASPDLGRALFAELVDPRNEGLDPGLRIRILEAAARTMRRAPADRAELARELAARIENSRHPMGERNKACELMGEMTPEQALTVLGPIVGPGRRNTTTPDHEFVLRGWFTAAEALGRETTGTLCDIAGDAAMETISRVTAFEHLAGRDDARAIATMESVMVESTGDMYTRQRAVRSYLASVDASVARARFEEMLKREADQNMQVFLQNTLTQLVGKD
jgi:hypothetical protein